MKFQHGLLEDANQPEPKPAEKPSMGGDVDKNRLFETLEEEATSGRSYLKLFAIVVLLVIAAGVAFFYLTLPGIGDQVRAPKGMEEAIRDQMLTKQRRAATDVAVYYCGDYYWARVGVESRTDVPGNPLASVNTYTARITGAAADIWDVDARPMMSTEQDKPCAALP